MRLTDWSGKVICLFALCLMSCVSGSHDEGQCKPQASSTTEPEALQPAAAVFAYLRALKEQRFDASYRFLPSDEQRETTLEVYVNEMTQKIEWSPIAAEVHQVMWPATDRAIVVTSCLAYGEGTLDIVRIDYEVRREKGSWRILREQSIDAVQIPFPDGWEKQLKVEGFHWGTPGMKLL